MLTRKRLEIGSGTSKRKPGYINADIFPGPNVDVVFDARNAWPFKNACFQDVNACHVLEHLPNPSHFFAEAHRVLAHSLCPNLHLRLPYGPSDGGIGDITHVRQFVPVSFCCFQPGYNVDVFNPQFDGYKAPFSIISIQLVVAPQLRLFTWPILRRFMLPYLRFFWNAFTEMIIEARALKTDEDVRKWREIYKANIVPIGYISKLTYVDHA